LTGQASFGKRARNYKRRGSRAGKRILDSLIRIIHEALRHRKEGGAEARFRLTNATGFCNHPKPGGPVDFSPLRGLLSAAVEEPLAERRKPHNTALWMVAGVWRVSQRWARFMLAGPRLGVPELVDFIGRNHIFRAIQVPGELEALGEILAPRRPECALEIGTAYGGTLLFLTRLASPQATIASVDLPGGRFGGGYSARRRWFYQRFARRRQRLHLLQGDSHSSATLDRLKAVLNGRALDYLFIDGDHSYDGVKCDFETYGPLVRNGGLIAFHDIVEGKPEMVGGVPKFWHEIKSRYRHREIIRNPRQGGYGIGVLYVG